MLRNKVHNEVSKQLIAKATAYAVQHLTPLPLTRIVPSVRRRHCNLSVRIGYPTMSDAKLLSTLPVLNWIVARYGRTRRAAAIARAYLETLD
jgi:hypothetical protein